MFRFWYRFVPPNFSLITRGAADLAYSRIAPELPAYMGGIFEEICKQYLWIIFAAVAGYIFQSTLRRTERRHNERVPRWLDLYFNPRSDERSDWVILTICRLGVSFQSTLRRTERQPGKNTDTDGFIFQSTLRRTERLQSAICIISVFVFQSTLRRTERQIV